MSEYVTLLGAEEVRRAGNQIAEAAYKMQQVSLLDAGTMMQLENMLQRFEAAVRDFDASVHHLRRRRERG